MARSGVARDHGSGSLESRRGRSMARAAGGTPARAPAALLRATRWCGCSAAREAEPEPATSWLQGQGSSADRTEMRKRSEENTSELQSLMRSSYAVYSLQNTTHKQTQDSTPKA